MTPNRALSMSTTMFVTAAIMFLTCGMLIPFGPLATKASGMATGDAANGKILFEKRCSGCHALDRDKEGPRLGNVYGRKAGSVASFQYSDALKSARITWDATQLDRWLTDPDAVIPDNDMTFHVPIVQERTDIIEYLRVASGK
jgi:cytochrome c